MKRKLLNGYWIVFVPEHAGCMRNKSHNGWEYEHRYVMEVSIGRLLENDEVVHHINGDRLDNSPENLELLSRKNHTILHAIADGKHVWPHKCRDCGKPIVTGALRCAKCDHKRQMSQGHPTKEQLEACAQTMTNREIAKRFSVSDTTVGKWRKKYGIPSAREQRTLIRQARIV